MHCSAVRTFSSAAFSTIAGPAQASEIKLVTVTLAAKTAARRLFRRYDLMGSIGASGDESPMRSPREAPAVADVEVRGVLDGVDGVGGGQRLPARSGIDRWGSADVRLRSARREHRVDLVVAVRVRREDLEVTVAVAREGNLA